MDVSQAVAQRKSIRSFLSDPVDDALLRELLAKAARSPSGGNVQPWRVIVVNGASMADFREHITTTDIPDGPTYDIYPPKLWEPYRTNRFRVGEMMYATMGIERDDKAGRLQQFARNGDFFGAPAAFFCYIDNKMGPPQWSDLGMFLQTFMLLAEEAGLNTCAQEFWSVKTAAVDAFTNPDPDWLLFCGMAIGKADPDAPINTLESERQPLDEWATFL